MYYYTVKKNLWKFLEMVTKMHSEGHLPQISLAFHQVVSQCIWLPFEKHHIVHYTPLANCYAINSYFVTVSVYKRCNMEEV